MALRAAHDGANVVIAAKSDKPHRILPGTIHSAAEAIVQAGGKALAVAMDVRDEAAVEQAVTRAVEHFGGIDICVNNASAIALSSTPETSLKKFDLLHQVNVRGAFAVSRACLPHLRRATNPHILTLSPPLTLRPDWFASHLAYTMSKYGMSMVMLGLAEELRPDGIACNCLWPRTTIATAAIEFGLCASGLIRHSRKPEIMADAAAWLLSQPSRELSGCFLLDEECLARAGITDLDPYAVELGRPLQTDLFVAAPAQPDSAPDGTAIPRWVG
ncbi:MAG: NAD(P)-dependent oxidoreductase [Pseudomonadota bacterium]|nr:NAD(P)-dependent oxidoreductase [Pseudomonadota bacterium]